MGKASHLEFGMPGMLNASNFNQPSNKERERGREIGLETRNAKRFKKAKILQI